MNVFPFRYAVLLLVIGLCAGCANIMPPAGGKKDILPPKLLLADPGDSLLHARPKKIELDFNEYITLSDPGTQIQISPLLSLPLNITTINKHVIIRIPDTLLQDNTTYRITFGNAIRDLHEGNIFTGYSYIFSTGSYFDSLSISGQVINAMTGLRDSTVSVMLYDAAEGDSAIVRHKPLYITHAGPDGSFSLKGLPARKFRLYALRDLNGNLTFDGGKEWIGFLDYSLMPRPDTTLSFTLRTFMEETTADTASATAATGGRNGAINELRSGAASKLPYLVLADTSDSRRRTQEITRPLIISFTRKPGSVQTGKVYLTYDSTGITMEALSKVSMDTSGMQLQVATPWLENTVYTLRLQKGFAKDSAGNDFLPGRFTFRTKRDEDYARLQVHLPGKYYGKKYVLQVLNGADSIYRKPVTDTIINLAHLPPGDYILRIIEDRNGNGRWDPGDLLGRKQPELVIPYDQPVMLKPGWEHQVDFEQLPKEQKGAVKPPVNPEFNKR